MSANLYRTKEKDRFYHIHGSLDATTCLEMIGLPAFIPGLEDYDKIVDIYQEKLDQFTVDELEELNTKQTSWSRSFKSLMYFCKPNMVQQSVKFPI